LFFFLHDLLQDLRLVHHEGATVASIKNAIQPRDLDSVVFVGGEDLLAFKVEGQLSHLRVHHESTPLNLFLGVTVLLTLYPFIDQLLAALLILLTDGFALLELQIFQVEVLKFFKVLECFFIPELVGIEVEDDFFAIVPRTAAPLALPLGG